MEANVRRFHERAAMQANAREKSRRLREMSRELNNRSILSIASSTGSNHGTVSTDSTMSDFNPDNDEAIMSTRQMNDNDSQKLPRIRDTAKKIGRWGPKPADFAINTSLIGRAFPNFSQGGSSDDSMSIELPRGTPMKQRNSAGPSKVQPLTEYSDNIASPSFVASSPATFAEDFQMITTPKRGQAKESILKDALRNHAKNATPRNDSRKENIPPNSHKSASTRGSPYVSHASRAVSGERKTLAELHARVADESDGSFIATERPATVTFQPKNSRFSQSNTQTRQTTSISSQQDHEVNIAKQIRSNSAQTRSHISNATNLIATNASTPNPTTQSFLLPNLPEISLNAEAPPSGVPIVTRGGKVQSRNQNGLARRYPHETVDGIPIPDEEEDIYLSVDLLKARAAQLESENADAQLKIADLQSTVNQLRMENVNLEKRRRRDSALGSGDDSDAGSNGNNRDVARLAARAFDLETRLGISERRESSLEIRLKSNTAERDSAISQLALANRRIEELESSNELLETQKRDLEADMHVMSKNMRQWIDDAEDGNRITQQQKGQLSREVEALRSELKLVMVRLENAGEQNQPFKKNSSHNQSLAAQQLAQHDRMIYENLQLKQEFEKQKRTGEKQKKDVDSMRKMVREIHERTQQSLAYHIVHTNTSSRRPRVLTEQDEDLANETDEADISTNTTIHKDIGVTNPEVDSLELSDVASCDASAIAEVREYLRQIRKSDKVNDAATSAVVHDNAAHTSQSVQSAPPARVLPGILKNSGTQNLEDLTGRFSIKSARSVAIEEDLTTKSEATLSRRHSDPSGRKRIRRPRYEIDENMTSAFLIPDISINAQTQEVHPTLSATARQVLDGLCEHDQQNCTICARITSSKAKTSAKVTVQVPKPIPVSDRIPVAGPYEDEPTLRPSVDPSIALATVIKGLNDEIEHLTADYERVSAAYKKHDASLRKRQRKIMSRHMTETHAARERKKDQLYALYDVLEGLKQSGQMMTEEEIEVTLMELGLA